MRGLVVRQRLVASAALVAACGAKADWQPGGADPSAAPGPAYTAGTALISDGTDTVLVGGVAVKFPTTVTDAAWSADGSRIAFIAADGNVATARLDGSGLITVTTTQKGVVRSDPVWSGGSVAYTEVGADGKKRIKESLHNADPVKATTFEWQYGGTPEVGNAMPSVALAVGKGVEGAFVHVANGKSDVWVADTHQRAPYAEKAFAGTEPAVSPDGMRVAFVDGTGHVSVATRQQNNSFKAVRVTFDDAKPTHLVWTPAGDRIAYSTATGVQSVAASVPAGATANPPTEISAKPGIVTFLPDRPDKVVRITGADPVETAINASQALYPTSATTGQFGNSTVGATIVDLTAAVSAVTPSGANGPLLFTAGAGLDQRSGAELQRLFGKLLDEDSAFPPYVSILGGAAVPPQVDATIRDFGWNLERPTGPVAGGTTGGIFAVVSDSDLAVQAAVGGAGITVLTSSGSSLPAATRTYLNGRGSGATVYGVGAEAKSAVSASWSGKPAGLKPIAVVGASPAATVAQLYRWVGEQRGTVVVADRGSVPDVAVAVAVARSAFGVVLLVDHNAPLDPALATWLSGASARISTMYIVDSANAVSPATQSALAAIINGPLAPTVETNPKAVGAPKQLGG